MAGLKVRELCTDSDLPRAAALLEREITKVGGKRKTAAEHYETLKHLLLDNPDRALSPPGWILEDHAGKVFGVHLSIPRVFRLAHETIPLFFSAYYFVEKCARGLEALGLFLAYRALMKKGVVIASSANQNSAPIWRRFGAHEVPGTGVEWLKPNRFIPLVEQLIYQRSRLGLWLPPPAEKSWSVPRSGFDWLRTADELAEAVTALPSDRLEPYRSLDWLKWRFLGNPSLRLYRWDGGEGPIFLSVALSNRGYRGQVRCITITDGWSRQRNFSGREILQALASTHRRDCDLFAVRGIGELTAAARDSGWRQSPFVAPMLWMSGCHGAAAQNLFRLYPESGA